MKKSMAVTVILLFIIGTVSAQQNDFIIGSWNDSTNDHFIHIFTDDGRYIFGFKESNASYAGTWVLKGDIIRIKGISISADYTYGEETTFEIQITVLNNDSITLESDNWFGNNFSLTRVLYR